MSPSEFAPSQTITDFNVVLLDNKDDYQKTVQPAKYPGLLETPRSSVVLDSGAKIENPGNLDEVRVANLVS